MARRTPQNQSETPTEGTEAPVESTATETPAEGTESAPTEAAAPVDLSGFQAAAQEAVANADASTGDVSQAEIDKVNAVYRDLDGVKAKNQARSWIDDQMKAAIMSKEIMQARAYVTLKDGLSAGTSGGPKAPADPTTAFVQRVAALTIAQTLVQSNVPEGVGDDWSEKVDALVTELSSQVDEYSAFDKSEDADAEQPEVSPVVRQAFKIAAGKGVGGGGSGRTSGGPRRNIEEHLKQVFADEPVGAFLTVNEIAKKKSTEYGDDSPSAGAVSARLFPAGKEPYNSNGIQASNEEGKVRGATKVA